MLYTVVGYHGDNFQPCVAWVEAGTALKAAAKALSEHDDLVVVEVFDGTHKGKLENDEVLFKR